MATTKQGERVVTARRGFTLNGLRYEAGEAVPASAFEDGRALSKAIRGRLVWDGPPPQRRSPMRQPVDTIDDTAALSGADDDLDDEG